MKRDQLPPVDMETPRYVKSFIKKAKIKCPFVLRIGSVRDGGYFVTHRLVKDCKFLISGGIYYNVEFERDFKEINPNIKQIWIDPSYSVVKNILRVVYWILWRRSHRRNIYKAIDAIVLGWEAVVIKKFICSTFNITEILNRHSVSGKAFLKIDIEGSEYEVLESILAEQGRFLGIAIEFHDVDKHIEVINNFLRRIEMEIIGLCPNNVGGISSRGSVNTIEVCLCKRDYLNVQRFDEEQGAFFSNDLNFPLILFGEQVDTV